MAKILKIAITNEMSHSWRREVIVTLVAEQGILVSGTTNSTNIRLPHLIEELAQARTSLDEAINVISAVAKGKKNPSSVKTTSIDEMQGWQRLTTVCRRCRSMKSFKPRYVVADDIVTVWVGEHRFSKPLENLRQDLDVLADEALTSFGY